MRVFDRFRKLARRTRSILKDGKVVGSRIRGESRGIAPEAAHKFFIRNDNFDIPDPGRDLRLLQIRHQQLRRAVFDTKLDAVRPKQGEQGNRNRAKLHRAKNGYVERPRRLEHYRDSIARAHPFRRKVVRKTRRLFGKLAKTQNLVVTVGVRNDDGSPLAVHVAVDAFVCNIQVRAISIE